MISESYEKSRSELRGIRPNGNENDQHAEGGNPVRGHAPPAGAVKERERCPVEIVFQIRERWE